MKQSVYRLGCWVILSRASNVEIKIIYSPFGPHSSQGPFSYSHSSPASELLLPVGGADEILTPLPLASTFGGKLAGDVSVVVADVGDELAPPPALPPWPLCFLCFFSFGGRIFATVAVMPSVVVVVVAAAATVVVMVAVAIIGVVVAVGFVVEIGACCW